MASRATRTRIRGDSNLFQRLRLCQSQKVGYRTRQEALDQAEQMMAADHVQPGCHITPYACQDCGAWHVANRRIVPVPGQRARRRQ